MGFETPNMPSPEEMAETKKESKEKAITEEEFKEKTEKIIVETIKVNIKEDDFNYDNPEDKKWLEAMMDTYKMVSDGNYAEPKFFAGSDGLRVPKSYETPEGLLKERLQRHKDHIEKMRQEHSDDWKEFVPEYAFKDIDDLEQLLNFVNQQKQEKPKEEESAEKQEKREPEKQIEQTEKEEIFNQQIENLGHPETKNLQTDVMLFLDSLDRYNILQDFKTELDEILYRRDIEYEENKKIEIPEENKEIMEPLLEFRQELDKWNTFTESKVSDYRRRIFEYLKNTFGVEEIRPKEGEKYNSREQKTIKVVETDDPALDGIIQKINRVGFMVNDNLWEYHKNQFQNEDKKRQEELKSIKRDVSESEFDKEYDKYSNWKKSHRFAKSIRPAEIIIYKYKK